MINSVAFSTITQLLFEMARPNRCYSHYIRWSKQWQNSYYYLVWLSSVESYVWTRYVDIRSESIPSIRRLSLLCQRNWPVFSVDPGRPPPPLRLCLFWWCSIADSLGVGWRVHTSFSAAFHKFSRDLSLPVQNNAIPGLFASFVHFHYRCFAAFGCRCYDRAAVVSVVLTLSSSSSTAVVILNYHSTLGRASFWISSPGFRAMFGLPVCRFIHFQS